MTSAELLWDLFAPAIAGNPAPGRKRIMRLLHNGTYSRRLRLSTRPTVPAAVPTYDFDGRTRCLVADFDTSKGRPETVRANALEFAQLIRACGGDVVVDRSVSGGQHVYVPLQTPRELKVVAAVMAGLTARYTTLDPGPMQNAATGCIRPPGSAHPKGGHQQLLTPVEDAKRIFARRNPDDVWRRLCGALGPVDYVPLRHGGRALLDAPHAHRPGGRVPLSRFYEELARTGVYDASRYRSNSEARQAVLSSAYQRGWTLADVAREMDAGTWGGMNRFYARLKQHRTGALYRDWKKASLWAERVAVRTESTQGGDLTPPEVVGDRKARDHLRAWWTAMRAAEPQRYADRSGQSSRLVLRAIASAAQRSDTRYPKVGVRSLALGSNLDHSTVAKCLRRLRSEPDPLIVLVEGERGHGNADIYELRIPDAHAEIAKRRKWRPGIFESIHPAFAELGVPAALVYDALGERRDAIGTVKEVAAAALIGRDAAGEALRTLAAYGLVERSEQGWRRGPASLAAVADVLGAMEWHQERVERYRNQREKYKEAIAALAVRRAERQSIEVDGADVIDIRDALVREPDVDDEGETVIELLERTLGAVLVPT